MQIISGSIRVSDGNASGSMVVFHKLLSKICPDTYYLERVSIYESPMRAKVVYAKDNSKLKPVLNLKFSESENRLYYDILPPKRLWPWAKGDVCNLIEERLSWLEG